MAAFLSMGLGGVAHAQMSSREAIELQNQIADLRQQLNQAQGSQAQGSAGGLPAPSAAPVSSGGGNDLTAQLLERVTALESQNREMRGELDQLTNQVQQQNASLSKQISDMNFAMQNGGGHGDSGAAAAPAAAPAAAAPAPKAAAADPASQLATGRAALMARNYATAEQDARAAMAGAKGVSTKMEAQYLLAQSLAGQKQYRQSAVAYYDAYGKAPHSARAQDALLGVAASMLALGDKSSACQALAKLHAEFPSPQARVKAAETSFKSRAACH